MELVEFIIKIATLVTSCVAIIVLVVKLVRKYCKFEGYDEQIEDVKKTVEDLRTSSLAQFQTFAAEQTIQTHVLNAVLDGLQQLGCNHTVPKAKAELEEYLIGQAHKVDKL